MIFLILFAFIAGVVTILSPCILPILPIILSSSASDPGKKRPLGVVTGFVASFTFFTLFLSSIVRFSGLSADFLRFFSIAILFIFGLTLLIPQVQVYFEKLFMKMPAVSSSGTKQKGFVGGVIIGLSLGLLWTPCVGPILASVISLALSGTISSQAILITLAYSLGTAIPMFLIMMAGSTALRKVPWLLRNTAKIQRIFGVIMIATSVGLFFNIDRSFQTFILNTFPKYGAGLTKFEETDVIKKELLKNNPKKNNLQIDTKTKEYPDAPEIIPGGQWFNSEPVSLSELKGKVVLIDFWTYSCINCQRTLPYLSSWWEKYEDDGLVIIGVHSPEFEFEKNPKNVEKAISDFDIKYPVMQDNNFETWKAYNNRYWPAKYLIDKNGKIRYTHFGEGKYQETEKMIQELLEEAGTTISDETVVDPVKVKSTKTPETYLGSARIDTFVSPEAINKDVEQQYSKPDTLQPNDLAYEGLWTVTSEYASPDKGSSLFINFNAKEVYLVARAKDTPVKAAVFLNDVLDSSGEDVIDGEVTFDSDRLYKILNQSESKNGTLRLDFEDEGAEVYAFTFG